MNFDFFARCNLCSWKHLVFPQSLWHWGKALGMQSRGPSSTPGEWQNWYFSFFIKTCFERKIILWALPYTHKLVYNKITKNIYCKKCIYNFLSPSCNKRFFPIRTLFLTLIFLEIFHPLKKLLGCIIYPSITLVIPSELLISNWDWCEKSAK